MKTPLALLPAVLLTLLAAPQSHAQRTPNPTPSACGATEANFNVKHETSTADLTQPPPGKALVYLIESMPDYPMITKKVNIGLDGAWLGATDAMTHMSFVVDPGIHHLCAVYQGHAAGMDEEGRTLLLHLDAQAGHIYYLSYHAFITEGGGIAFFQPVDEDEGQLLLQTTDHSTSVLKK